jgi:hypothetical protein
VVKVVLETCIVGYHSVGKYTHIYILTNNSQELMPYRFGIKCDANRNGIYFMSMPRFEHGSLGGMTYTLANSAIPPLSAH